MANSTAGSASDHIDDLAAIREVLSGLHGSVEKLIKNLETTFGDIKSHFSAVKEELTARHGGPQGFAAMFENMREDMKRAYELASQKAVQDAKWRKEDRDRALADAAENRVLAEADALYKKDLQDNEKHLTNLRQRYAKGYQGRSGSAHSILGAQGHGVLAAIFAFCLLTGNEALHLFQNLDEKRHEIFDKRATDKRHGYAFNRKTDKKRDEAVRQWHIAYRKDKKSIPLPKLDTPSPT